MKKAQRGFVAALCFSVCAPVLIAQGLPAPATPPVSKLAARDVVPELPPEETIVKDVNEVNLVFSVRKGNKLITDLQREELLLRDNNKPPESIHMFSADANLPIRVGVLVDASDSVTHRFAFEKAAAGEFLGSVLRGPDQAFVLGFSNDVSLTQDLTNDHGLLKHGLDQLRSHGQTALFDAVTFACDRLSQGRRGPQRRSIVLITDGMDNHSTETLNSTIENALRAEVIIFALSTNRPTENPSGEKVLTELVEATGGRVLRASNEKQISKAFNSIEQELRSQYVLAYKPAEFQTDGKFRSVQLKFRRGGLHASVRRGYYAQVDASR